MTPTTRRRTFVCLYVCVALAGGALAISVAKAAGGLLAIKQMEREYVALVPLDVHQQPSEGSTKVEHLLEGTRFLVTGQVSGTKWYRVVTEQRRLGYVLGDRIAVAPDVEQASAAPEPSAPSPAEPDAGFQDCPSCPRMIPLPAGSFQMGDRIGDPSERPVRRVQITSAFALGRSEITVTQWMACVDGGGCSYKPDPVSKPAVTPVRNVSWDDAMGYVRWLSKTTGKAYRLPSEAEWEYAARAGTTTPYWWGAEIGSGHADCRDCGGQWDRLGPAAVDRHPANPFGLLGMNGGVAEWTADCWVAGYQGAPQDGSARKDRGCRQRVLRGGSWRHKAVDLRSAARLFYDADVQYAAHGFRVALTQPN